MVPLKHMHFILLNYISVKNQIDVISDQWSDSSHLWIWLLESTIHVIRYKWHSALHWHFPWNWTSLEDQLQTSVELDHAREFNPSVLAIVQTKPNFTTLWTQWSQFHAPLHKLVFKLSNHLSFLSLFTYLTALPCD